MLNISYCTPLKGQQPLLKKGNKFFTSNKKSFAVNTLNKQLKRIRKINKLIYA